MTTTDLKHNAVSLALAGAGLLAVFSLNHHLNRAAEAQCRSNLYILLKADTGVGPAYHCKSHLQVMGPPAPIKD